MNTVSKKMIIGLGLTGVSVARWCARQGHAFDLCDTRASLNNYAEIAREFPHSKIILGPLDAALLCGYDELIVSPGVPVATPAIQAALSAGVTVSGDVEVFARDCQQPIIAITGSNGKSTVTTLVGMLLQAAGVNAVIGGNIGVPVLDLPAADLYVLELSSFQLETTRNLHAHVAVILNISEDHLDRYDGMAGYIAAKQRIFNQCNNAVINVDDAATQPPQSTPSIGFGLTPPAAGNFGLVKSNNESWIALGDELIIAASELKIKGQHNLANVMAALALVKLAGVELSQCLPALREFAGLPYRCQWLGTKAGVSYYNDSKGTNVGSTLAAINGLGPEISGKIWLLVGGEGKGQDFSPLAPACTRFTAEVICYGKDAALISQALSSSCQQAVVSTLDAALVRSHALARSGDIVLLSPACASFDQFKNYMHRGEYFSGLVEELL